MVYIREAGLNEKIPAYLNRGSYPAVIMLICKSEY